MTFKTVFSAEYQMSHFKEAIYKVFADARLEGGLKKGQTVSRSYASDVTVNDMGADGSYETQAITDTAENLVINKEKEASIYIKDLDQLQAHLPVKKKYGRKLANALINQIDADVLGNMYASAGNSLDDGHFGGTTGNGLTATSSNVATIFVTAKQKLRLNNVIYNKRFQSGVALEVPEGMPTAGISPEILTYIELYLGGKDTLLGDKVSTNGYTGYFQGFECFLSNSLPWTGQVGIATNPTDGDTIVINGVTITFVATLSGGTSEIHITGSAAATVDSLVAFLNAPGTAVVEATNTGIAAASATEKRLLKNFTAVDGTTIVAITAYGWGTVEVSETFTAGADVWTVGKEKLHIIFALSKSISLVIQKKPSMTSNPVSGKIGKDFIAWTVYGSFVFVDQAPMIVTVAILSSAFTAASTSHN